MSSDYQQCLQECKEISAAIGEFKNRVNTRLDWLERAERRPDAGSKGGFRGGGDFLKDYRTPGERIIGEKDLIETFAKTRRARFQLGSFFPVSEQKTLIDSSALGFSTPGVLGAERIDPAIVSLPRRRLTIRDILRSRPVTQAQADFIRELAYTNAASPQAEGNAKAESADTFVIASEKIRTIAHWIPLSKQVWDDLPELQRFINENLIYGLKLKEETEILNGDNLGDHLNGIATQATSYAGTYAAAGDTKLDKLRHIILELEAADEQCSAFVLNPKDVHDIDLIKNEQNGVNTGTYVVGDPLSTAGGTLRVKTLWNRPIISTNSMSSGRFLAGDFSKAIVLDRMDATVDVSEEHSTFFTENKIAVRAEERVAIAVLRVGAFRYGSF